MKEYKAEIGVIAAGPSGLSAAVQAAQLGAKVVVVEKAAAVGGAANMGMGILAVGSHYQKAQMIDISIEKAFNMFMDYTHYNVDARLIKRYFPSRRKLFCGWRTWGWSSRAHSGIFPSPRQPGIS